MTTTEDSTLGDKPRRPFGRLIDWIEEIADKSEWIECPLCRVEYNKLRACVFYEGEKEIITHICVGCAEQLTGFARVIKAYPINKPFDNWSLDWISTFYFNRLRRFYIKAWAGERKGDPAINWFFYKDGMGLVLYDNAKGEVIAGYSNTVEAWIGARKRIGQFFTRLEQAKEIDKNTWGGKGRGSIPKLFSWASLIIIRIVW